LGTLADPKSSCLATGKSPPPIPVEDRASDRPALPCSRQRGAGLLSAEGMTDKPVTSLRSLPFMIENRCGWCLTTRARTRPLRPLVPEDRRQSPIEDIAPKVSVSRDYRRRPRWAGGLERRRPKRKQVRRLANVAGQMVRQGPTNCSNRPP